MSVRVRKRHRPDQIPLRERTFYGCSSIDQYNLGDKLGQGTFGEVKKAIHFLTGTEVALKKVTIHDEKDGMPLTALREIKLLKKLSHPSIVAVIDMAYRAPTERGQRGEVYMVEPYMDHDLNGMLENHNIQFTIPQIKLYMKQLLEGTLHLHQNKILHRDMKAANLLINNKGQLHIADFGLARPFHDPGQAWVANGWQGGSSSYTGMVVTRWYRPPELLAGDRKYGPPIDMWGLGCILGEMITRKPIFRGTTEINQLEVIAQLCGSPNEDSYPGWNLLPGVKNADPQGRAEVEPDTPGQHDFGNYPRQVIQFFTTGTYSVRRELADLLDKMLVLDPCKRITAKEALEHEWFWIPPFPADPNALPTFEASKELDRQRRDQHLHQQQRAFQQQQHQLMAAAKAGMAASSSSSSSVHQQGNTYQSRPVNGHQHNQYPRPHLGRHYHPPITAMNQQGPTPSSRPVPRMRSMGMGGHQGPHSGASNYNQPPPSREGNPYDQLY